MHVSVCSRALCMDLCAPVFTCMHVCVCPVLSCTCVPECSTVCVRRTCIYVPRCSEHVPVCPCALYLCALEPRNGPISPLYFYPFCMPFYGTRDSRLSHSSPLLYLSSLSIYLSLFLSLNFSIYSPHSLPFPPSHLNSLFPVFCIQFSFKKSLFYERELNLSG